MRKNDEKIGLLFGQPIEQYEPPTVAQQLREITLRTVKRELEEVTNKMHSVMIQAAEKGLYECKYEVKRKLIDDDGLIEHLRTVFGNDMKIKKEEYKNPFNYLVTLNWKEGQDN